MAFSQDNYLITWRNSLFKWFFCGLYDYRLVMLQLVKQQITLRYRRTIFGFLWTLLNPLLNMAVIATVFSLVMRFQIDKYAIFLFSAMIPWSLFSGAMNQSAGVLLANEHLFKKIYLPKQIFVASSLISLLIDCVLSTLCLFLIALAIGAKLTLPLLGLPVAFILLTVFSFGLSLIVSVGAVFFRDLQYLVGVVMQALYFMTPIIYPITAVPEQYHWAFIWNPMYYFVQYFRAPLYDGVWPSADLMMTCTLLAVGSLLIGLIVFRVNDKKIIFRL